MQDAEFPEFVPLRVIKQIYGVSPHALGMAKHRGSDLPFPLYRIPGIQGFAVRFVEVKAYFDSVRPVAG